MESTRHKKTYDDIIHLPHHVSATHPYMPLIDRAAQFFPFAALTDHSASIKETSRLTDGKIELDKYMKGVLEEKLHIIAERLKEHPEISFTYFQPDAKKKGGAYIIATGTVKR